MENDELVHRVGRAGRGLETGVGVYLGQDKKMDLLSQQGQIQVFGDLDSYWAENKVTEGLQVVKEF